MKYILFLFFILFSHSFVQADPGTKTDDGVQVNLGINKTDYFKPSTDFTKTMDSMNNYKIPSYSYGSVSGGIVFGQPRCTYDTPQYCILYTQCVAVGGYWNAIDSNCGRSQCHFGTTPDMSDPTKCKCNGDPYAFVQRGNFLQSCPSTCFSRPNQSYSFMSKSCECNTGYTMATNGTCNPNPTPAPPPPAVSDCWNELVEKATACETSANTAVTQCEPPDEDQSITALRGLLMSGNGSAGENCERAATASTSGYYQTNDTRKTCDDGINSCKTSCGDAKTYMNANKERLYNACRERALQAQVNMGPALPADRFNPMWDAENKATLDSQFQGLIGRVDTSKTTCESGTAAKNREKLSATMNDMNTSAKSATECACQLNSKSADCSSTKGPADCSKDSSLPGCAKVADNCFDPKNTSIKCICFRNPESNACKEATPTFNVKAAGNEVSNLAGTKATDTRSENSSGLSGMAGGKGSSEGDTTFGGGGTGGSGYSLNGDDLSSGVEAPAAASGSSVSSLGNSATPAAPAVGSGGGGGTNSAGANSAGAAKNNSSSVASKLGGLFDTAKSAIGGIFNKGSGGSGSDDYRNGGNNGSQTIDPRKFRPRGTIVRGVASEEELAGKHEDIWKVMSKQYKVQDQKDNFIFDSNK